MHLRDILRIGRDTWRLPVAAFLIIVATGLFVALLFMRARTAMEQEIKVRLRSTAAAAAMQFNADILGQIETDRDGDNPALRDTVARLDGIRRDIPLIRYAYILRRTDDPSTLAFIADADTLRSEAELDTNGNRRIEEEELPSLPGDLYDISDTPALQHDAFEGPTTDATFTVDAWGTLISGYAPIRDADGNVAGVLGIDMRAEDFTTGINSIFSPLAAFSIFLGIVFVTGGMMLLVFRRKLELLERMSAERSGLLQLTFHQLGEPLTIFKWSVELLRETKTDQETLDAMGPHLSYMDEGIARLNGIVDALSDAEKVEKGTFEYNAQTVAVADIVQDVTTRFAPILQAHKGLLTVEVPDTLVATADRRMVADALARILQNAIDYSPEGSPVTIRAVARMGLVEITVTDQGDGIATRELPHIGEKYVRGSTAYLRKPDGKGLNLYTARGIIEKAGGTLWIRSREGKGTTVSFSLPAPKN